MRISDLSSDVCSSYLVRFYLPPETRCAVASGREPFKWPKKEAPKTLGEQLTTTVRRIVKANPDLAGVIDTVDFNETRNGEREISDKALKGIVETFSDPRYRLGLHDRSEEHTSELQSLMRISYAVFCLKTKKKYDNSLTIHNNHRTTHRTNTH